MRVPFSWLKECLPIECSPTEVAQLLTMAGLEAEGVKHTALPFNGVVVGEVLEVSQHPDADKLRVAQVTDGNETVQVVCGAANCRAGIKVAFARVGSVLTAEEKSFKIKKSKLRSIASFGMLCAAIELGLAPDDGGIMELPKEWIVGRDLTAYYGDTVIELALTPNLGHCFSILGVARELSAITKQPAVPRSTRMEESTHPIDANVDVQAPEGCKRYAARVIRNVTIGSSPDWMQRRLEAAGMRPVNNVVDVTNYVMLELGQPLHAFDYAKLVGHQITVRRAQEGETLVTLDGTGHTLSADDLVIGDRDRPVALAGVMGGAETEVTNATTTVLLEAAYFDPSFIRRSAKRLRLHTESSKRFERGTDPNGVLAALDRAASLIQGEVDAGVIDYYPSPIERREITLRVSRVNQILGTQLGVSEVEGILKRLGCSVTTLQEMLAVQVPTYRSDLRLEIDLIEEVARIYGYHNIPQRSQKYSGSTLPHTPLFLFERRVRQLLAGMGAQELVTSNLISPTLAKQTLTTDDWIPVLNPASVEQSVLRLSLFPGLLQVAAHNAGYQQHNLFGFEIGRIHFRSEEQLQEETELGLILTGDALPPHWDQEGQQNVDFFDLKGVLEDLFARLGTQNVSFQPSAFPNFHPGRQASLLVGERQIGFLGEVHPRCLRALELRHAVYYAEVVLPALRKQCKPKASFTPLPQFPGSTRDWTATLSEETAVGSFLEAVAAVPSRLLKKVCLSAIYRGDSLGVGWKNTTFRFVYRDDRKTISDQRVEAEHQRIVQQVKDQLGERIKLHES